MQLPYIIAEAGLNHNGDYATAHEMIRAAAYAGANAVKFQYVKADRLVSRTAPTYFQQNGQPVKTQHEFFARSDRLDREDYERLAVECNRAGVDFLCTVYDLESVHWVAPLVPAFKVASADISNTPLLKAVRSAAMADYNNSKGIYLSTGAATLDEVIEAWKCFHRTPNVTFLHCVLSYPTAPESAALRVMQGLPAPYGYSDHTLFNLDVLTTAWLLGASVIEKHFTLDKSQPGNDHYHSMDPTDLRALVAKLKELQVMIGDGEKRVLPIEEPARQAARQSLHASGYLAEGAVLQASDLVIKRPADGLPPGEAESVIGRTLKVALQPDDPITEAVLA